MIVSQVLHAEDYAEVPCSQQKVPDALVLGYMASCTVNLQLEIDRNHRNERTRGMTTLTLREVPKFLVDAFRLVNTHIDQIGLFRKVGNMSRINKIEKKQMAIFCGKEPIPNDLSTMDVCTLIKSFFQHLKVPLFCYSEIRDTLMEFGRQREAGAQVSVEDVQELFRTRPHESGTRKQLPEAHIGTTGYLMRQLYNISLHSDKNHMTAANLATVFGPTLLGKEYELKLKKKSRSSGAASFDPTASTQEQLIHEVKVLNDRAVSAVQILIERAEWIGLHPECYVSSQARSNSAAPLNRVPFGQLQPTPTDIPIMVQRSGIRIDDDGDVRLNEAIDIEKRKNVLRRCSVGEINANVIPSPPVAAKSKARRSLNLLSAMLTPKTRRRHASIGIDERENIVSSNEYGTNIDDLHKRPLNSIRCGFRMSRSSENRGQNTPAPEPANALIAQVRHQGRRSSSVAMKEMFVNFIGRRKKSVERVSKGGHKVDEKDGSMARPRIGNSHRSGDRDPSPSTQRSPRSLGGHQSRSRLRDSPKRKTVLDIVSPVEQQHARPQRQPSRSSYVSAARRHSSRASASSNNQEHRDREHRRKSATLNRNPTPGPFSGHILGFPTFDGDLTPNSSMYHKELPNEERQRGVPRLPMNAFNKELISPKSTLRIGRVHDDPSVSVMVESSSDASQSERRRRHTSPVKFPLRRNAAFTGCRPRRNTQVVTSEEKENLKKRRSHSVEDVESTGESADDVIDDMQGHDVDSVREQMAVESRQRRVRKQRRKESPSVANASTSTSPLTVAKTLTISPPSNSWTTSSAREEPSPGGGRSSRASVSPLVLTKSALASPKSAKASSVNSQPSPPRILQVTPTNSPVIQGHHSAKCSPGGCSHQSVTITHVVARRASVPVIVQEDNNRTLSLDVTSPSGAVITVSPSRNTRDQTSSVPSHRSQAETSVLHSSTQESSFSCTPKVELEFDDTPELPSFSSPEKTLTSSTLQPVPSTSHIVSNLSVTETCSPSHGARLLKPMLSLDSHLEYANAERKASYGAPLSPLCRNSASRVPLSPGAPRPPIAPKPSVMMTPKKEAMGPPPVPQIDSPMGKRGLSTSGLERRPTASPIKNLPRQTSAEEFSNSERTKQMIFTAQSGSELDMVTRIPGQHTNLELRPSVAFIAEHRRGLVQDRVNMFGQLTTHPETGSGRTSVASSRASSGTGDFEFARPTLPTQRRSQTSVTRNMSVPLPARMPSAPLGRTDSSMTPPLISMLILTRFIIILYR